MILLGSSLLSSFVGKLNQTSIPIPSSLTLQWIMLNREHRRAGWTPLSFWLWPFQLWVGSGVNNSILVDKLFEWLLAELYFQNDPSFNSYSISASSPCSKVEIDPKLTFQEFGTHSVSVFLVGMLPTLLLMENVQCKTFRFQDRGCYFLNKIWQVGLISNLEELTVVTLVLWEVFTRGEDQSQLVLTDRVGHFSRNPIANSPGSSC